MSGVLAIVYVSEGVKKSILSTIRQTIQKQKHCLLGHSFRDVDYNRTSFFLLANSSENRNEPKASSQPSSPSSSSSPLNIVCKGDDNSYSAKYFAESVLNVCRTSFDQLDYALHSGKQAHFPHELN